MNPTAYRLFILLYSPDVPDFTNIWGEARSLAVRLIAGDY